MRRLYTNIWNSIAREGQWRGEIWNQRKSGEVYPAWENMAAVKDSQGRIVNYVSVFSDISSIKKTEERLAHMAHHDGLTGLPNRVLFTANLEQSLEHAHRHDHMLAVLFLDIDHFKTINDTLGHALGDGLLQTVASRLKECVRAEDTVARLGGDEFIVLLYEISRAEDAARIAEKIMDTVSHTIFIDGSELVTSTSVGISLYPNDATNCNDLIKAADAAMYRAKERGGRNFQFHTLQTTVRAVEHL